jgi:hypothetical protein
MNMGVATTLNIYDRRPAGKALQKRLQRDGVTGALQAIVVKRDYVRQHGSFEVICTGVFKGDRLVTFYQTERNGSIRRVKSRNGRFERTYLYAAPYREAEPRDFRRAGVSGDDMDACAQRDTGNGERRGAAHRRSPEATRATAGASRVATCIGCGCDDLHACWDDETNGPCSWVRVDRRAGLGVCSVCPGHVERWDRGDRKIAVPVEPSRRAL